MATLEELGPRIIIIGPSNSGKSTLTAAISRARGLSPIFLDQLAFLPHSDWVMRPEADFDKLHDDAIQGPDWVMEGNYTRLLPQRLERATGFILLDVPVLVSLWRYLRRCWFGRGRAGALEGGRDSVKWEMIKWLTIGTAGRRKRLRKIFNDQSMPRIRLDNTSELNEFYRMNGLTR